MHHDMKNDKHKAPAIYSNWNKTTRMDADVRELFVKGHHGTKWSSIIAKQLMWHD